MSRFDQLLGAPPEDSAGRAAWCGIAYRLEAALDDRAAASRLAWSKGPFDRLARGLLDSDPVAVAHAQEIISAADGIADEPSINLADSTEWEQPTKVGTKAVRHANGKSAPDAISGFEV